MFYSLVHISEKITIPCFYGHTRITPKCLFVSLFSVWNFLCIFFFRFGSVYKAIETISNISSIFFSFHFTLPL